MAEQISTVRMGVSYEALNQYLVYLSDSDATVIARYSERDARFVLVPHSEQVKCALMVADQLSRVSCGRGWNVHDLRLVELFLHRVLAVNEPNGGGASLQSQFLI